MLTALLFAVSACTLRPFLYMDVTSTHQFVVRRSAGGQHKRAAAALGFADCAGGLLGLDDGRPLFIVRRQSLESTAGATTLHSNTLIVDAVLWAPTASYVDKVASFGHLRRWLDVNGVTLVSNLQGIDSSLWSIAQM